MVEIGELSGAEVCLGGAAVAMALLLPRPPFPLLSFRASETQSHCVTVVSLFAPTLCPLCVGCCPCVHVCVCVFVCAGG